MDKNADGWSSRAYSAPPSSQPAAPAPAGAPARSPVLVGAGLFVLGVSSLWAILRLVPVSTTVPAAAVPALPPPAAIDPPRAVERAHRRPMEAEDPAEMAARYTAAETARAEAAQGRQAPPAFELEREPAAAAPAAAGRLKPSTFRRVSSLGQAPARPQQADGAMAALGAAGVLNGIPPQLTAIAAREVASHPRSIPVLLKLIEYAKLDDQSGAFRQATRLCGSLYRCVPKGVGRTDFILESGLKVAYTYVPSAAWGLRNQFQISSPDGQTAQYMDSPLVFDLGGDGVRARPSTLLFDLAGDGRARRVRDLSDAVLAFDRDGDGVSGSDGRELLGNRTDLDGDGRADGFADGFAALRALAGKAGSDGRLDAEELAALSRQRGLRLLLGGLKGRAARLEDAGVAAVRLSAAPVRRERDFDGWGDDLMVQEGAVFERTDGSTGAYADAWLRYLPTRSSQPAHLARLPD